MPGLPIRLARGACIGFAGLWLVMILVALALRAPRRHSRIRARER